MAFCAFDLLVAIVIMSLKESPAISKIAQPANTQLIGLFTLITAADELLKTRCEEVTSIIVDDQFLFVSKKILLLAVVESIKQSQ